MSSAYGKKWWQRILALLIIITIPATLVYIDYTNDPIRQYQDRLFYYDITLNSTVNQQIIKLPTDIPVYSTVNLFANFSNTGIPPVVLTILERSQINGFLVGQYPVDLLHQAVISDMNYTGWFNHTTAETGPIYLAFTYPNASQSLNINGMYNFVTEPYVSRKAAPILLFFGAYAIVTFGIIPYMISRFRINKMKRRKQQELIQEEEEFYRRYDK